MNLNFKFHEIYEKLGIKQEPILVAVSGGVDSMVLLDLLQRLPLTLKPKIHVATVDHCLRPESEQETKYVKQYCEKYQLKFHTIRWEKKDHPDQGVEEAGRIFRYSFFSNIMQQYKINHLLTAHHADDQIETVLMKFIRGGDLHQLQGISLQRPFMTEFDLSRPLLFFSKDRLYEYAHNNQIVYFEDSTNQTDDFLRNRLRHQVIPTLKKESPNLLGHLASYQEQLADLLEVADSKIRKLVEQLTTQDGYLLSKWRTLTLAEKRASLRLICTDNVGEINESQLTEMVSLLQNTSRPQGKIDAKGEYLFYKSYENFGFTDKTSHSIIIQPEFKRQLRLNKWVKLSSFEKIGLFPVGTPTDKDDDVLQLSTKVKYLDVRHRQNGDKLLTLAGPQKVKKILIDQKIPSNKREQVWVVSNGSHELLWVVGHKKSDLSRQDVNDKIHYIVIYRKISGEKRLLHE